MDSVLSQIINILTGGISGIASGIGSGLTDLVSNLFLNGDGLSTFGVIAVSFAGISLAFGLSRLVVKWITSLGGRGM